MKLNGSQGVICSSSAGQILDHFCVGFAPIPMAGHDSHPTSASKKSFDPLLADARNGSTPSLGELTERCRRYLLHVARRELHPDLRAKVAPSDLVQQTLIHVQRNLQNFRGETEGEFQAWLRQILLNQARGAARYFKATAKRNIRRELPLEAVEADAGPRALVNDIETPSKQAVRNERMQALASAIGRLPDQYRQVIELRSVELRSFTEIAQVMSRSEKAARSLWVRAVDALRDEMEGMDESR